MVRGRGRTLRSRFQLNNGRGSAAYRGPAKYEDIVLGFRGTDSSVNVKVDLKFKRVSTASSFWYEYAETLKQTISWRKCVRKCIVNENEVNPLNIPSMKIHSGFIEAFEDIRGQLLETVLTAYHRILKRRKTPRFYITGHSLGGALAQLCGLCLEILFGHRSPIHSLVVFVF